MEKREYAITSSDFEKTWGEKLSDYVKQKIKEYNFRYEFFSQEERDKWLLAIAKTLLDSQNIVKAGKHRHSQWESGWEENLKLFLSTKKLEDISPRYFGKYGVLRWRSEFIKPLSENFERNSLYVIQDRLFDKYLRNAGSIYEFGCGTGHNLFRVQEVNPSANLYGLDWAEASKNMVEALRKENFLPKAKGGVFNFFEPDYDFHLDKNSVVYTVAALEQIGPDFKKFVDYLIREKPMFCVHIEPIAELLDENRLLDYLSINYFKLRNYLSGFLTHLRELEGAGKIKIHEVQRSYIGSLFIEGYSVIVWSPKQ